MTSILAVLLIVWGVCYASVYQIKKKKNTHKQSGYKILFIVILVILIIALVSSLL
ncbi:hypothetical protein D3C74_21060 [compost metagenome]